MRYWPVPSLTTDRTFSISTGLAASTVTPGRIAPDVSFATPVIAACAYAAAGRSNSTNRATEDRRMSLNIALLLNLLNLRRDNRKDNAATMTSIGRRYAQ